jgi:predicted transcriptional regulator
LQDGLKFEDKVLVLLLQRSPQLETELQRSTEYRNVSRFGAKLQALHNERLIERSAGKCFLSPKGSVVAERVLAKSLAKELR